MARTDNKIQWFAFFPQEWIEYLTMDDAKVAARFKELIIRLGKNEAPEGTIEARMIAKSLEIRQIKREAVAARWNKAKAENAMPAPPAPPQRPPVRKRPPSLAEVYDYCQEKNFPDTFGREWFDWQESRGWNTLKSHWHFALAAFCRKKLERGE